MWEKGISQAEKMAYTKAWKMVRMSINVEELGKVQNDHSIKSEAWGRNGTRGVVINQGG